MLLWYKPCAFRKTNVDVVQALCISEKQRPCPIQCAGIVASGVGAYAPLGVDGALLRKCATVSRLCPCVPEALATIISRLRSGSDARYLQVALMEKTERPPLLDASDADVTHEMVTEGLARSDALVLSRAEVVLTRPWALMELFFAMRHRIPVIPLRTECPGYEYFETQVLQ